LRNYTSEEKHKRWGYYGKRDEVILIENNYKLKMWVMPLPIGLPSQSSAVIIHQIVAIVNAIGT
jgi:hypothetical protein